MGYIVVYEYAGKQYTVQMPNDPGPTIRLQLTPVGMDNVARTEELPAVAPGPVVYREVYIQQPYYPPFGVVFGIGGWGGAGHRRWR